MSALRRLIVPLFSVMSLAAGAVHAQQTPRTSASWRQTVDSMRLNGNDVDRLADAWRGLGEALQVEGQVDSSLAAYRQAVKLVDRVGERRLQADILLAMGSQLLRANMNDSALSYVQRGRDLRFAIGDTAGARRTWNNTGAAHYQLGNYEQALGAFAEALRSRREAHDTVGVARVLTNIGKVYQDWGQNERAEARLREAVEAARASGNPAILGYALNTLAQVYVDTRQFDLAYRTIDASMAAYSSTAPKVPTTDSLGGWRLNAAVRAEALLRQSRAREAIPVLDSLAAVGKENGNIRSLARSLMLLGEAAAQLGQLDRAREQLTESLRLSRSVEQRVFMLQSLERLSAVEEQAGNAAAALRALRSANALRDTIFNRATAERLAVEETREERERQREENAQLRDAQRAQAAVIERQRLAVAFTIIVLLLSSLLVFQLVRFNRLGKAREEALARTNDELRTALSEVRTLTGLIPICANCKRVRDDRGYWQAVESYISHHSDATFSHAICASCGPALYGELWAGPSDAAPEATRPAP